MAVLLGLVRAVAATAGAAAPFDPPAIPTEVEVGAYVIDLVAINGAQQSFEIDLATRLSWNDPRLAAPGGATRTVPLDDVWHPRLAIANARNPSATLPEVVEVQPDGTVLYRQRVQGTFSAHFDLRQFPRDRQTLPVHLVARGYSPAEILLLAGDELSGRAAEFTIADWEIGGATMEDAPYRLPGLGMELAGVRVVMEARRLTGYYLGSVFASATIIICMAWMVFWLDPAAVNPRVSVSVTSMLTLIAYRFVTQGQLPRLPYLTRMDWFLLGSSFLVLLGLVGVVIVQRRAGAGDDTGARRVNLLFRWVFPAAFAALLAAEWWL